MKFEYTIARRTLGLMVLSLALFLAGSARAHWSVIPHSHDYPYSSATDARFFETQTSSKTLSVDNKTLTVVLPPASVITANSPELVMQVLPVFDGSNFPPDDDALVADPQGPHSNQVQCWNYQGGSNNHTLTCKLDPTFATELDSELTITVAIKGDAAAPNGGGSFPLTWTFVPTPGGPYMASLNAPTVTKGELTIFRATLTDPAPAGGTSFHWELVPADCFEQASGGVAYGPGQNELTIAEANQWREFAVQSVGCGSSSAWLKTWIGNQTVDAPPYYQARTFALLTPEDGAPGGGGKSNREKTEEPDRRGDMDQPRDGEGSGGKEKAEARMKRIREMHEGKLSQPGPVVPTRPGLDPTLGRRNEVSVPRTANGTPKAAEPQAMRVAPTSAKEAAKPEAPVAERNEAAVATPRAAGAIPEAAVEKATDPRTRVAPPAPRR